MCLGLRFLLTALLLMPLYASAQVSNLRMKLIPAKAEEVELDSLSVIPNSIGFPGNTAVNYIFDSRTNSIKFDGAIGTDSLLISYRTFPFRLDRTYSKRSLVQYDSVEVYRYDYGVAAKESRDQLFSTGNINKTGNYTRGISFGNNQDVFVNSALNLQMEGQLTDEIKLTAAITDQNIPVQPEGNTQQIQDFDQVYIQLENKHGRLKAGDLVLRNRPSNFLSYYKNVQGGEVEAHYDVGENSNATSSLAASIAKGKFASTLLPIQEGVQGPYRLRGPENERFIIIIANSEKVFLDGQLLTRGFNYDYVIDYNQGEIIFNNNIVITRFSRVRVDFEYSERNYARTDIASSHYQEFGKTKAYFNFYSETDNPRNPLALDLTQEDQIMLSEAGDSLGQVFGSTIDSVGFADERILYQQIDTVINGTAFRFYRYSTNPSNAFYTLGFSELPGRGDYQLVRATANGRIFRWVAPVNGVPQGNYAPMRLLPTPKKKQMMTVGAEQQISQFDRVFAEVAVSEHDLNRYSPIDDADNNAAAVKVGYVNEGRPVNFLDGYKWTALFDVEHNQENFTFIDRVRYIEFDRDWSANPTSSDYEASENIVNAGIGLFKNNDNRFNYTLTGRKRGEEVDGTQQNFLLNRRLGRFQINSDLFLLKNDQRLTQSEWQRLNVNTSYRAGRFTPGYIYSIDKNKVYQKGNDSVVAAALNFEEHRFYFKNSDSSRVNYLADYAFRRNNAPMAGELMRESNSQTANLNVNAQLSAYNQLNTLFTYRILDNVIDSLDDEETIQGRIDWNLGFFKNLVRSELTLTAETGRELRREFIFLESTPGQGTHFFIGGPGGDKTDYSLYVPATESYQRNYIKIFVPTDDYVKAYSNSFNYRLNLRTPREWRERGRLLKQFSRLSNSSSWTINKKITENDLLARFVPFYKNVAQDQLLSIQENLRSTMFYNRTDPKYGTDFAVLIGNQKNLLTNGFEQRMLEEYRWNSRLNLQQLFNVKLGTVYSVNESSSDFLTSRNFKVEGRQLIPELSYQPKNTVRFTGTYAYSTKQNIGESGADERATINRFSFESRVNKVSKRTINAVVSYVKVDYNGERNTPLAFEMLDSFQPGDNFTWNFNIQQKLANGLQLNIIYEGRKSQEVDIIHIGRMQVSALF